MPIVKNSEPAERATDVSMRANIQFNRLSPRSAGSNSFLRLILGLTPQAGVPSRASRLGWKTLCCRALRALVSEVD
jgi:hypothetical protein